MKIKDKVIFACVLFSHAKDSELPAFSDGYDATWADKLYRGLSRHYTGPFDFYVFTDKDIYNFQENEKRNFYHEYLEEPDLEWGTLMEPLKLHEQGCRIIVMGLDTVIVGNIDKIIQTKLFDYGVGLPSDPYQPKEICNAIAIFDPKEAQRLWINWITKLDFHIQNTLYFGQLSEMAYLRTMCNDIAIRLDLAYPGEILSYKAHVRGHKDAKTNARIVYFHGLPKCGSPKIEEKWINKNWI